MCVYSVLLCVVCLYGGEKHKKSWLNSLKVVFSPWLVLGFKTRFQDIRFAGSRER